MSPHRLAPALALPAAAALALVASLGLSACAPDGATPKPSGSSSSAAPSASASASASGTASPSGSPTGDAAACLPGTWNMAQGDLDTFYADVNTALAGSGVTFTPQGTASLVLGADGSFSWKPALQLSAAVSGTNVLVTVGGHTDGTYAATADRITTSAQDASGLQISATIDGAPTDAGSITDQVAGAPISDAAFTCAGDTLTLKPEIGGAPATAVLHRG